MPGWTRSPPSSSAKRETKSPSVWVRVTQDDTLSPWHPPGRPEHPRSTQLGAVLCAFLRAQCWCPPHGPHSAGGRAAHLPSGQRRFLALCWPSYYLPAVGSGSIIAPTVGTPCAVWGACNVGGLTPTFKASCPVLMLNSNSHQVHLSQTQISPPAGRTFRLPGTSDLPLGPTWAVALPCLGTGTPGSSIRHAGRWSLHRDGVSWYMEHVSPQGDRWGLIMHVTCLHT